MSREPTHNDSSKICWDDFAAGDSWVAGAHAVTKEEILAFGQQYDPEPFHSDEAAAEASIMGGLIASGVQMAAWFRMLHYQCVPPRWLDALARLGQRPFPQFGAPGRCGDFAYPGGIPAPVGEPAGLGHHQLGGRNQGRRRRGQARLQADRLLPPPGGRLSP